MAAVLLTGLRTTPAERKPFATNPRYRPVRTSVRTAKTARYRPLRCTFRGSRRPLVALLGGEYQKPETPRERVSTPKANFPPQFKSFRRTFKSFRRTSHGRVLSRYVHRWLLRRALLPLGRPFAMRARIALASLAAPWRIIARIAASRASAEPGLGLGLNFSGSLR